MRDGESREATSISLHIRNRPLREFKKLNASSFPSDCEFTAMKLKLMTLAALALTAVLISGCSTTADTTTTTTTTDRTQSSMYAR